MSMSPSSTAGRETCNHSEWFQRCSYISVRPCLLHDPWRMASLAGLVQGSTGERLTQQRHMTPELIFP